MSLLDSLRRLGERIGIIRLAPAAKAGGPVKIVTREMKLSELTGTIPAAAVSADEPLIRDFTRLYELAGVEAPARGWSAERLADLLASEPIAKLERSAAQAEVLALLQADGVDPEAVVGDAIRRDQAVDGYAAGVLERLRQRSRERAGRLARIEAETAALNAERTRLVLEDEEMRADWKEWWQRKFAVEQRLATAASILLERPVVSVEQRVPEIVPRCG
jgi:hypothetical protein